MSGHRGSYGLRDPISGNPDLAPLPSSDRGRSVDSIATMSVSATVEAPVRQGHALPPCPVCGTASAAPWLAKAPYRLHRCAACGLGFVWPIPSAEICARVYDAGYLDGDGTYGYHDGEVRLEAQKARQVRERRALLHRHGYAGRRALDLGCGDGWWLEGLRPDHDALVGIEPMEAVRAEATLRLARSGSLTDVRLVAGLEQLDGEAPFDLATAFDVLEHLRDPAAILDALHARLAPGGLLCAVLPIADHWTARLVPARWDQCKPPEHLWYHSRTSLRRLLGDHGFAVVDERSAWNRWPRPLPGLPAWLQRPFRIPMKLLARLSPRIERGIADSLLVLARRLPDDARDTPR